MSPNKYIIIDFPEFVNGKPTEIYGVNYRQHNCPPESARSHDYLNNAIARAVQYKETHPNILIAEVSWRVSRINDNRAQEMYIVGLIDIDGTKLATNIMYNVHSKHDRQRNAVILYDLVNHGRKIKKKKSR